MNSRPDASLSDLRYRPPTVSLLGTPLAITDYKQLLDSVVKMATLPQTTAIDFCNTQTLTLRRVDPTFIEASSRFDYFVPDGMPLIWCLRAMGVEMQDRVYGPAFMGFALGHEKKRSHYFLGGSQDTSSKLVEQARILSDGKFRVAGTHHGYFTACDNAAIVEEINRLSPDVIWVGLGTPKQQTWIHGNKHLIKRGVLLSVGFAFDVNAGTKRDAPLWMQRSGITWIFRVSEEPSRLMGRYLKYNTLFVLLVLGDFLRFLGRKLSGRTRFLS